MVDERDLLGKTSDEIFAYIAENKVEAVGTCFGCGSFMTKDYPVATCGKDGCGVKVISHYPEFIEAALAMAGREQIEEALMNASKVRAERDELRKALEKIESPGIMSTDNQTQAIIDALSAIARDALSSA